jgi:hypothetical protein
MHVSSFESQAGITFTHLHTPLPALVASSGKASEEFGLSNLNFSNMAQERAS